MKTFGWNRARKGVLAVAAAMLMTGCYYDTYDTRPVYHDPYRYDYYYYPSVGVYYHLYSGYYYYHDDHYWYRSRRLPPRYRLDPHDRVKLKDRDSRPYQKYDRHREKYHPAPDYRSDRNRDRRERDYLKRQAPAAPAGTTGFGGRAPKEEREAPVREPGKRPPGFR
jgi:hypothetical protein